MRTGVIYKLYCIKSNHFLYGQTINFKKRIRTYKSCLKNKKANRILQHVYDKYGWESLRFEIVQENIPENILEFVEDIWMGSKCSIVEDKKKGMNVLTTTSRVNKKYKFNSISKGSAQKNKTGYDALRSKEIHQYDLNGNYLKSYGSVLEASRINKCCNVAISNCANKIKNKKNASCNNYMWGYEKYETLPKYINERGQNTAKKVKQYDKDMNFIKEYNTIGEACRELKLFDSNIIKSAKSNFNRKTGGYYWSY